MVHKYTCLALCQDKSRIACGISIVRALQLVHNRWSDSNQAMASLLDQGEEGIRSKGSSMEVLVVDDSGHNPPLLTHSGGSLQAGIGF